MQPAAGSPRSVSHQQTARPWKRQQEDCCLDNVLLYCGIKLNVFTRCTVFPFMLYLGSRFKMEVQLHLYALRENKLNNYIIIFAQLKCQQMYLCCLYYEIGHSLIFKILNNSSY